MTDKKEEKIPDYLDQPETFQDIAKICVKKQNKGPFDEVVSTLYRYQKLIEYFKTTTEVPKEKNKLLLEMLTKGLRYKNFQEFKEENVISETFSFLSEIADLKSFYKYLIQDNKDIKTSFLELIRIKLKEHENGLDFLRLMIEKQIKEKEKPSP